MTYVNLEVFKEIILIWWVVYSEQVIGYKSEWINKK